MPGLPGLAGLRGVGGGVRAGVRGVEDDESVGHHTEDVNNNFGTKSSGRRRFGDLCGKLSVMASRVACFRETARQGLSLSLSDLLY